MFTILRSYPKFSNKSATNPSPHLHHVPPEFEIPTVPPTVLRQVCLNSIPLEETGTRHLSLKRVPETTTPTDPARNSQEFQTTHHHQGGIHTNLPELGMNLSGSQHKTTLALTIPRSNQVVYKGFPTATGSFPFEHDQPDTLPCRLANRAQVMIRTGPKDPAY